MNYDLQADEAVERERLHRMLMMFVIVVHGAFQVEPNKPLSLLHILNRIAVLFYHDLNF